MEEKNSLSISVVVPIYNEENGVRTTAETLYNTLLNNFKNFEIVCVNDGSKDKTLEVLKGIEAPHFKILSHSANKGYGASLKYGIREAKYKTIVIIDADLTYPYQDIPDLVKYLDSYDMVVGARQKRYRNTPFIKALPKFILDNLANVVAGKKIADINSGFRVFKKETAEKFFHLISDRFSFTTTITLSYLSSGLSIKYVPIRFDKREGKSKVNPKHGLDFATTIVKTVMYFNPLRVFAPPAFMLMSLGFLKFVYDLLKEPYLNITDSAVFLFLAGFQILALGLLADLIRTLSVKN